MKHLRSRVAIATVLLIATAACGRSDDSSSPDTTGGSDTTTASGDSLLADGGFGDLEKVCQDGDAKGATATGVTDTEIHIATTTDKGGAVAGLNKEMFDAATAFTKWCNDHGGIQGRHLVLDDADAKLFEYEQVVTAACSKDFALVGGGAVFDSDPNDVRVKCGMPDIPGFVVSEEARTAKLQVQPIPNPVDKINVGRYEAVKREFPDDIAHYGIMTGASPSTKLVRDQLVSAAEQRDFTVDYSVEYAIAGETGWDNFANQIKAKGIKILEFVGTPSDLVILDKAFETAGYRPDVVLLATNFYDRTYLAESKGVAGNVFIQSSFYPFEQAKDHQATQDYLDLMEQYNPGGKIAQLGEQSLSALLLFAVAASECGSDLTGDCLLEKAAGQEGWTGGGLHSEQTPGNTEPGPCTMILTIDGVKFAYDEQATAPTDGDGELNCDPENVSDVSG